jgi:hypothetical protein
MLPLVGDEAHFDEMLLLLLAIAATTSSLSVLASVIAACELVVRRGSQMAVRDADCIFAIVYPPARSLCGSSSKTSALSCAGTAFAP